MFSPERCRSHVRKTRKTVFPFCHSPLGLHSRRFDREKKGGKKSKRKRERKGRSKQLRRIRSGREEEIKEELKLIASSTLMAGTVTPSTSSALPTQNPISVTPAARAFFGRLYDGARSGLAQRRPWMELADRNQFAKPDSLAEATTRTRKNWTYFRVNYIILLSLVLVVSLVSHPVSLFVLVLLLSGWLFLYLFRSEPLVLFNRTFSDREVLGILLLLTIVVIFLTSVGSLIISTLMIGLAIVCTHAAFRVPEDLFLDEQEASGGFLSFLGTVPSAASVVAGRV